MPNDSNNKPRKTASPKKKRTARKPTTKTNRTRATARPKAKPATQKTPDYEAVRQRAYFLYLERGGSHGDDQADWFRAERELTQGSDKD